MGAIIPKKFGSEKLKIKGNITIIDLICMVSFSVIAIAIAAPLLILGIIAQIIIGVSIFVFLMIFILPDKKTNRRIYMILYLFFKYKFSNKRYEINNEKRNTKFLIPYSSLIGKLDEIGILCTDELFKNKKFFISAVELEGFNLLNMSFEEQEKRINLLNNLFVNINVSFSLVKLEKKFNKLKASKYINKKMNDLENDGFNKNQINSRMFQLKSGMKEYFEENNMEMQNFQHKYYLFLYCNDLKSVKEVINSILNKTSIVGLNANSLNGYELINTIKYLLDPLTEDFSEELIEKNKNNLKELLSFEKLSFNKTGFEANEIFYSTSVVREFPKFPNRCWMLPLMETDGSVIINISNLNNNIVKKNIENTILNLNSNLITMSKKEIINYRNIEQELEIYNELASNIGYGNEVIKSMNIVFLNYEEDNKKMNLKNKIINNNLKEMGFIIDNLTFCQFEGLSSILPKPTDPLSNAFSRQVPCSTITEGFPFISNEVNDEKGFKVGEDMMGNPVIFDQFKLTKTRKNHNMLILGTSGSGKTTFAKLLMNYHICAGRKVIIIDVEREYKKLCDYHFGNWIDVGSGSSGRINPFQIFTTIDSEINQTDRSIISNHISFLVGWFEILFSDVDKEIIRCFSANVAKLYESFFEDVKDVANLSPEKYPIMDDLIKFINITKKLKENTDVEDKLINLLKSEFQGYGQFSTLYNGFSTVIKDSNPLLVFDIHTLYEKGQNNIILAQLYLITAFISNEVNNNFLNSNRECFVLIDEAHLLIDKDKPIALNFTYQMSKRIRKRRGALAFATQNPEDFLGSEDIQKKTMAMLNNVQYQMIMNLSSKNIQDVEKLYSSYGDGLSKKESDYISQAAKGAGLFMITGFERYEIQVKVSKDQFDAFENNRRIEYVNNKKE